MIPRHYLDDSASKGLAADEHFAQPVENMVDQVASRVRSTKDMDYVNSDMKDLLLNFSRMLTMMWNFWLDSWKLDSLRLRSVDIRSLQQWCYLFACASSFFLYACIFSLTILC